jgi:hypothetical protein
MAPRPCVRRFTQVSAMPRALQAYRLGNGGSVAAPRLHFTGGFRPVGAAPKLRRYPGSVATSEESSSMSDSSEFKIQRWERYIDESRRELKLLSPEGQIAMQKVIDSYESLIAMERAKDKRR